MEIIPEVKIFYAVIGPESLRLERETTTKAMLKVQI